jgi:hypothetical protein
MSDIDESKKRIRQLSAAEFAELKSDTECTRDPLNMS